MRARTIIIAIATLLTGVVLYVSWPFISLFVTVIWLQWHPEQIGWNSHMAETKCVPAITGRLDWPTEHAARCGSMSLCANEAVLTPTQSAALTDQNRRAGCPEF